MSNLVGMRPGFVALIVAALVAVTVPLARAADACDGDWPMYGHDVQHSFSQECGAAITAGNVQQLVPKWVVRAQDSVTASPTVVDGKVYVGSWDGTFYAIDAETGSTTRPAGWTFQVDDDSDVAFGRIVSSAAVARFRNRDKRQQKVIIFGGGASLYALDADGHKLASIDLDPRTPADKAADTAAGRVPTVEIESSPAVVGDSIFVGMDVHNQRGVGRTGLVKLRLRARPDGTWRFEPQWKFDPETTQVYAGAAGLTTGSHQGFGCGGVWSSPAVDTKSGLVFFGTSNCDNVADARAAGETWGENTWAINAQTGALVYRYQPSADPTRFATVDAQNAEASADDDFGASPNVLRLPDGRTLWGEGRKSATYYAFDTSTGAKAWETQAGHSGRVNTGFAVGGFLGSTAVQRDASGKALRVIGTTAIPVPRPDQPEFPGSIERSTWAVRAMSPTTGEIEWVWQLAGPSYGAPTIANGLVFVPDTFTSTLLVLDAETGRLLTARPVLGPPASAPAVVGDSVYLGGGTRETDAEFKGARDAGIDTQQLASVLGPHPLSPLSSISAFHIVPGE